MSRFQRLSALLERLRHTSGVSVLELAQEFHTERRTIQRDLRYLRDCGHPIRESNDLLRHYYLADDRQPDRVRAFLWCWEADFLPQLGQALLERRRLRILYRGDQSLRADWLEVEPRQLFFERVWQLRAYLASTKRFRIFPLERISACEVVPRRFALLPGEEPLPWHAWDRQGGAAQEVECQVSQSLALRLSEQPIHSSQQLQGNCLRLRVCDLDAFLDWMLTQNYCRVLEPEWLRQRFVERIRLLQI